MFLWRRTWDSKSHSVRSVWIEISRVKVGSYFRRVTLRKECVDWNTSCIYTIAARQVTLRKECVDWNPEKLLWDACNNVTLRKECVDWNDNSLKKRLIGVVTLRKECVDWNSYRSDDELKMEEVTLRKECVDWNIVEKLEGKKWRASHSVRSVWIEIATDKPDDPS